MSGLSILPTGHTGTPCASTVRQLVRGVIHKSPGWPHLEATLHVGPEQSALAEGNACAGQNELRSRHVVKEQHLFGGMDASPAHGSENLGNLWQGLRFIFNAVLVPISQRTEVMIVAEYVIEISIIYIYRNAIC